MIPIILNKGIMETIKWNILEKTNPTEPTLRVLLRLKKQQLRHERCCNNVEIMTLRVVPYGDEYDKDVALGIIYAADNGADIINTSFGKGFSPHSDKVRDAIAYAASKNVLIVNAAGNDNNDLDVIPAYPMTHIKTDQKWLTTLLP